MELDLPNICFVGKAGAGKTTAAAALHEIAGYRHMSIASPLKTVASIIWGEGARNDRDKLQRLGIAVREIDNDAWANLLVTQIHATDSGTRVVVDDCRFPNEVRILAHAGFIFVRVEADRNVRVSRLRANGKLQDESQLEHVSETAIDDFVPEYVVTNNYDRDVLRGDLLAVLNNERS